MNMIVEDYAHVVSFHSLLTGFTTRQILRNNNDKLRKHAANPDGPKKGGFLIKSKDC